MPQQHPQSRTGRPLVPPAQLRVDSDAACFTRLASPDVQAVVFDLDGTLIDHRGAVIAALAEWLPSVGASTSEAAIEAWFAAEERHFPAWRRREISFAEQRRRRLRDVLPLIGRAPGTDAELDALFAGCLRHYESAWTAFDDVDPALQKLTDMGLRMAVLSNGTTEQQNAKLHRVGLAGRVGPVFTAEDLGVAKPQPEAYTAVCARLGVAPECVLHVGDLYDLDVRAPRNSGLHAVHLDRHDDGPHAEPFRIRTWTNSENWFRA